MAEILALGISHYPPLSGHDERMAAILQRYRLDLVPGWPVATEPGLSLRQKYGMRMTLEPRAEQ